MAEAGARSGPSRPGAQPGPRLEPRLPPQATMGLLEYLTAHALDEDYAYAAERRRAAEREREDPAGATPAPGSAAGRHVGATRTRAHPSGGTGRRRLGWRGAVALAAFTMLVVVAAARTSQGAAADAAQRQQLAEQVVDARDRLSDERARQRALESETSRLQRDQLAGDASATGLRERVERLGALSGTLPVRGPGVAVLVDDAPGSDSDRTRVLDTDLQRLVNGLWAAGAEAISVNGERLTNLSTIRIAGSAITVNNRGLSAPYRLLVLGDPDTLPARFAETASGQAWLDLQRQVGLQLTITPAEALRLPAATPTLRFAAPVRGGGADRPGSAADQEGPTS